MRKIKTLFALFILCYSFVTYGQDTIFLGKPHDRPFMTVFKAQGKNTHTTVIVCSGGAYIFTSDASEGKPAARILAANGITAFLLDYRFPNGNDSIPLTDAQAAIAYLRSHAKEYYIKTNQVGILGYSAGGHLASTIGTHFQNRYGYTREGANLRPDFMVLVYPVISMADGLTHVLSQHEFLGEAPTTTQVTEFSNELQVTEQTPPSFIVAAVDDGTVKVANSLYFLAALQQHHVKTDLFLYAKGGHGFGVNTGSATVQWTDDVIQWIKNKEWETK